MTPVTGTFESFDGTRLLYEIEGEGDIDLLLCDGIGCDGFIWKYLRPCCWGAAGWSTCTCGVTGRATRPRIRRRCSCTTWPMTGRP
ncbi:MAG: hypothetical protein R3F43_28075 [bacterium]